MSAFCTIENIAFSRIELHYRSHTKTFIRIDLIKDHFVQHIFSCVNLLTGNYYTFEPLSNIITEYTFLVHASFRA